MKIMVINGSATTHSRTRGVAKAAEEFLLAKKADVSFFDVGADLLPIYDGSDEQMEHPAVRRLSSLAEHADGFFICTPEYHNGISGALKNALDFLEGRHFRNKPVAIAAAAGGGKGGINALNNLRLVMRGVYGLVLPGQFVADPKDCNEAGELIGDEARARIRDMANELVRMAGLLKRQDEWSAM